MAVDRIPMESQSRVVAAHISSPIKKFSTAYFRRIAVILTFVEFVHTKFSSLYRLLVELGKYMVMLKEDHGVMASTGGESAYNSLGAPKTEARLFPEHVFTSFLVSRGCPLPVAEEIFAMLEVEGPFDGRLVQSMCYVIFRICGRHFLFLQPDLEKVLLDLEQWRTEVEHRRSTPSAPVKAVEGCVCLKMLHFELFQ
jgi:hypothetical protein